MPKRKRGGMPDWWPFGRKTEPAVTQDETKTNPTAQTSVAQRSVNLSSGGRRGRRSRRSKTRSKRHSRRR
jgi:hypothetical protein